MPTRISKYMTNMLAAAMTVKQMSHVAMNIIRRRPNVFWLNQLVYRLVSFEEKLGTAAVVRDRRIFHVDAELVIQRGEYVLVMDRPVVRHFAQPVRGTDDLAHTHTAAGEEGARSLRPMITAAAGVDARRTPEFTPSDDADILI